MQKRNVKGIERVIYAATKKLQSEEGGPSNKGLAALARLLSAYTRATRSNVDINPGKLGMSAEDARAYQMEHGSPTFYDELTGQNDP